LQLHLASAILLPEAPKTKMTIIDTKLVFFNRFSAQLIVNGKSLGTIALSPTPACNKSLKITANGRDYWIDDTSTLSQPIISALQTLYYSPDRTPSS